MSVDSGGNSPPYFNAHPGTNSDYVSSFQNYMQAMEVANNVDINSIPNTVNSNNVGNIINKNNTTQKRQNDDNLNNMPPNKISNLPAPNLHVINTNQSNNPLTNDTQLPNNRINSNDTVNRVRNPYETNKENRFNENDVGPFCILIESQNQNIGRLHKMTLGKMLFEQKTFKSEHINNISNNGINQIRLEFSNYKTANELLDSKFLSNNNLRAYIPESILYRKGVIRNVDVSIECDELLEIIKSNVQVTNTRRILRTNIINSERRSEKTETMILTFRGQFLPDSVSIYGAKCRVSPYIYKVAQCQKCLRLGHNKFMCRSKPRCENCGQTHITDVCNNPNSLTNCLNCDGQHKTSNLKECPLFEKQKHIKKYMAYNNVGYKEAKGRYRNYSQVASEPFSANTNKFPPLQISNRYQVLDSQIQQEPPQQSNENTIIMSRPRRPTNIYRNADQNQPSTSRVLLKENKQNIPRNNPIINPYPPQPHRVINKRNIQVNTESHLLTEQYISDTCSKIMKLLKKAQNNPLSASQLRDCFTLVADDLYQNS